MEHPVLERIGSYRLTKHLGANETMQVYLAREEGRLGPSGDVVLKIVQNLTVDDARLVEQLRREAPARRRLNHPAIVRTYRVFDHESSLVYAVENVEGVSLAELMQFDAQQDHRPLSDAAAFCIAISVLNALAHAHGASSPSGAPAPVIHKAVNPSNIRIRRDGVVKLGGFGFVNAFGLRADRTGNLRWESAYMAPEQITGQESTPKVDVYAVGLILWELLTGRRARIPPTDPLDVDALRAAVESAP